MARRAPPTWPRSCCARCTTRPTPTTPAGGSVGSTPTARPPRFPSSSASPAPSAVGAPGPRLARHPTHQRPHRSREPAREEDQESRSRFPQLRELPAAPPSPLWRLVEDSPHRVNASPSPTLRRAEPSKASWSKNRRVDNPRFSVRTLKPRVQIPPSRRLRVRMPRASISAAPGAAVPLTASLEWPVLTVEPCPAALPF